MIARRLHFKKVVVVLDDIDHRDHLDYLVGNPIWYGNGIRIIATTRYKHLIETSDVINEVTTLVDHQAIKLFNQYAFVKKEVPDEYVEKLSMEVVHHAKGLPLALQVWGSLLHKRDITEWRSAMEEMKNNSNSEDVEKLRISYDRLETIQRDIFLDIACFFREKDKDYIMKILDSCYSGANIGLRVLIDKSLIRENLAEYDIEDFKEVIDINTELLPCLRWLDLSFSSRLMQTPNFTGMPNLECLNLEKCSNLKKSLEHLNLEGCQSLEKFPEILGRMKSELEIKVKGIGIRKIPSSIIQHQALLTKIDLSVMEKLVALPSSIGMLKDWSNDLICNSLFQNISSASDSLSLRALVSWGINIPHWFHHQGTSTSVSVNLPKHWYVRDNFLGFVVCYSGKLFDMTAHLIPLCDDGISGITEKLALSNHSECNPEISFLLIPLSGLWDTSKANGRTPNDYGLFMLYFYGEMKHYGLRLLYKVELELDANFSSSKKYSNILGRVVSFFSCKPRNLD
ncbi:hypothetical protein KY289_029184 [Solanum tuberosum]|nr:hypothetical protein KY289_029184 [Solanum tuberosum]